MKLRHKLRKSSGGAVGRHGGDEPPIGYRRGGALHHSVDGRDSAKRVDRALKGYSKGGFIAGAIKHPGALHRELGVPQGEKIPASKLNKAASSDNPTLRRRAVLAKTLGKLRPH